VQGHGHMAAPSLLLASELWCVGSQWLVYLVRSLRTFPGSQTLRALPLGWASYALAGSGGLELPSGHVSGTWEELCQVGPAWCFPMLIVSHSVPRPRARPESGVMLFCLKNISQRRWIFKAVIQWKVLRGWGGI